VSGRVALFGPNRGGAAARQNRRRDGGQPSAPADNKRAAAAERRAPASVADGDDGFRAVILAGGQGTRLRPYTTVIPKPLVPVGERPVLEHIIRSLAKSGVDRVDLCVNYLGDLILVYLAQIDLPPELRLAFHWEDEPLGTAGALRMVPDLEGTFIAMNGDVLTTLDYADLVAFHRRQDAALTIAMHSKRVDIDLGVIESRDGLVRDYIEKPSKHYQVSMGIYVYEERALRYLPPEGPCQFPDLVLSLLAAGERVAAYECDADWFDIGTVHEHERAVVDVERFPEKYDVDAPMLDPQDLSRTLE
jgi:NDP-sugar pyrophosphorylase family protein